MPENVCFGCGVNNTEGLHVKSEWIGEESICTWQSEEKYQFIPSEADTTE